MELGYDAYRAYCAKLGIKVSPQAQEVSGLLAEMETHWRKMQSAARWIRDGLTENETRMAGDEVHSSGMHSSGIARFAIEYDQALAAYLALEGHLQDVVNGIRRARGYEVSAFARLEDHPLITPEEDQARHALARLERHLASEACGKLAAQRRHLREDHGIKVSPQADPAVRHEQAHADELTVLRARVASFETAAG